MSKNTIFKGAGVAVVTPFNDDLSVNYDRLATLTDDLIKRGVDSIVAAGTTGEASTLTDDEHVRVIETAVKAAAGRVPVIAGTGSNDTAYAIELSKSAKSVGADALLLVSPYYNKTSQRGLVRHFTAIADAAELPVVLYNIPGRTNVNIGIDAFKELAAHPYIYAVKESGGDINYFAKILSSVDIDVYSGDDGMTVPVMSLGGKGVISVAANIIPEDIHNMCELALQGKVLEAGREQLRLLPFINALFADVNPIPLKEAMNIIGQNVGGVRLPLVETDDGVKAKLTSTLKNLGLL
ncbi:MAG: 4-hydroxy-tetrahydrodipicolinate synthase [Oscillospiraceae bacterium]|jgi:4-hydroxy-tetrahydrodipicolinate synthase|nr:4-hydroxy-tetrahydrodipicolinate synthase [Oscillospiraceae bacterium]